MPHSGYHRIVGFDRPFFEGWYFRVTLPEARDNLSLIYHGFDPDAKSSPRRAAGAQVCAPGGGYLFRESPNVDAFDAHPRHLALRMPMEPGSRAASGDARSPPSGSSPEEEFFEVFDAGARHRGYLTRDARMDDPDVWPPGKRVDATRWDFTARPVAGFGGSSPARSRSLAGWLAALPVFEPHYQILTAHGLATGWIERDGERIAFRDAPYYAEKNWGGAGFPRKWFWAQCNAFPSLPGLTVTATGGDRGVVILPNAREEVAGIFVHLPDGRFFSFAPAGDAAGKASVTWEVSPWGSWRARAKTATHEVEIVAFVAPSDLVPGHTTVLRAPADDDVTGMRPLCRECFRGTMRVSLWERAGGYFRGWGPGGDDPDAAFERGRCLLDGVESDVAAVEVGGGPWETDWVGAAEMKEPLGTLAAADVDPRAVEMFFEPVFGEGWVPGGL